MEDSSAVPSIDCSMHPLNPPKVVAVAKDKYLKPRYPFPDPRHLRGAWVPKYGQDITFGYGRKAPTGHSVGKSATDLERKMRALLSVFASDDKSGKAKRLFDEFLKKQKRVKYWDDKSLDIAAGRHPNILHFCNAALSAPGSGKFRIHQALKQANWDVTKIKVPTGLGVPAFNVGSKVLQSRDWGNGLSAMINGVQYVYVLAKDYHYDKASQRYCITLKFVFYDVFGLDDDDVKEFGPGSHYAVARRYAPVAEAEDGIMAWWQLQHQHGYAPLITRISVQKSYEAQAT